MGLREKLHKLFPKGFHLKDEEIIEDLQSTVLGQTDECIIPHVDVHEQDEPWELAAKINEMWNCKLKEWCFIRSLKGKYKNGKRKSRTTRSGHWKVTGKEIKIRKKGTNKTRGTRKTLVFYEGRVSNGKRTNWIMYEYHLNPKFLAKHNKQNEMSYIGCHLREKKEEEGANKRGTSEFDQANDPISISSTSSHFTIESGIAQDDPISMSDNPDDVATDQSSVVAVEDGSHSSCSVVAVEDGSHSSCSVVPITAIAEIPGNEEMQIENQPSLGKESIQFDNYFDCFSPSEFFNDLVMEHGGGLIDDDVINWEELNDP